MARLSPAPCGPPHGRDGTLALPHPLLTLVARQAREAASAGAAAISRAGFEGDAPEVLAAAGDPALLEELDVHGGDVFAGGRSIITPTSATCRLDVGGEARGALTLLHPRLRRGAVMRDCLASLTELATEAMRAAEAERCLAETMEASVGALAALLDLRDGYTGQHSSTVVTLCEEVGRRVGVAGAELEHLRIAAHLHDLGKIGVPDQILHKPGPLDAAEWSIMREHPVWGARALQAIPGFRPAARAVRGHHERWDGDGYPDGLAGEAIPIAARVIAVCDAYEAMTSTRPYRPALRSTEARERLVADTGTQFDPAAVWGLLDVLS